MGVATFVPWIIFGLALIVSITAAMSARRSARAASANAAIAMRAEQRTVADREDAAGPTFDAEPVTVHDRKAEIRLRMVGGPGATAVEVCSAGAPYLRGLSNGKEGQPVESLVFPPSEPGATLTVTAHLDVDVWPGHHDGHPLALLCNAESREEPPRRWGRRVSVLLKPPPPPPQVF